MTPLQAIRAFCKTCVLPQEIRDCGGEKILNGILAGKPCPFYPYRMGEGRPSVKVIRRHCLYCMNGYRDFVRDCETRDCPLHPFRMGKNPNISNETREKRRQVNLSHGLWKNISPEKGDRAMFEAPESTQQS